MPLIVSFGTYDVSKHPRVAVILRGLRGHGFEVHEANRPLGFSTAERVRMLQQPILLPLLLVRLLRCWAGLVADTFRLRRQGEPSVVLVGYMGHFDVVLARLLFPRATVVLDHLLFAGETARDRRASGLRVSLLNALDRLATACADVVVVDTEEHRAMLRRPERGVVVPVGALDEWFDAAPAGERPAAEGTPLRVVFFGLFTPLQGAPLIGEALASAISAGTDLRVTMVGSGQDLAETRGLLAGIPGVEWRDWVDARDLPALVTDQDVCLGIFSRTPKGLRVVPNKVFQGLAAGCVVVTSDTPPQRRLLGEHVELVEPGNPADLARCLSDLAKPERLAQARVRAESGRDGIRPPAVVVPLVERLRMIGVAPPHVPELSR